MMLQQRPIKSLDSKPFYSILGSIPNPDNDSYNQLELVRSSSELINMYIESESSCKHAACCYGNYCCSMQQQNFTVLSNSAECVQDEFLEIFHMGQPGAAASAQQHTSGTLSNIVQYDLQYVLQYWNTTKIVVYSILS